MMDGVDVDVELLTLRAQKFLRICCTGTLPWDESQYNIKTGKCVLDQSDHPTLTQPHDLQAMQITSRPGIHLP